MKPSYLWQLVRRLQQSRYIILGKQWCWYLRLKTCQQWTAMKQFRLFLSSLTPKLQMLKFVILTFHYLFTLLGYKFHMKRNSNTTKLKRLGILSLLYIEFTTTWYTFQWVMVQIMHLCLSLLNDFIILSTNT